MVSPAQVAEMVQFFDLVKQRVHTGELKLTVNPAMVPIWLAAESTPKRYKAAHLGWTWAWRGCVVAAVVCFVGLLWVPFAVLAVISAMGPAAIRESLRGFIVEDSLSHPEKFYPALGAGLVKVER